MTGRCYPPCLPYRIQPRYASHAVPYRFADARAWLAARCYIVFVHLRHIVASVRIVLLIQTP